MLTVSVTKDTLSRIFAACQLRKRKKAIYAVKIPDEGFYQRLADALSRLGGLQAAAVLTGYSTDQIAKWRDGKSRPPFHPLGQIAEKVGVSLDWLAYGVAPQQQPQGQSAGVPDDLALLPLLNVHAGAGPGIVNGGVEVIDQLPFSRALLRQLGVKHEHAHFIRVRGDSMEPTIASGAIALIDASVKVGRDGELYALVLNDEVVMKRLQTGLRGAVRLLSDNPKYGPLEVKSPDEIRIEGRVFWAGHKV